MKVLILLNLKEGKPTKIHVKLKVKNVTEDSMNLHYNDQQRLHCYPQRGHLSVQLGKRNLIKCYNMKKVIENYNKPL